MTEVQVPDYLRDYVAVRVVEADALDNFHLSVRFSDGFEGVVDCRPLFRGKLLDGLLEGDAFSDLTIDEDIGTVVWSNGADLAPAMLRASAQAVDETTAGDGRPASGGVIDFYGSIRSSQLHYGDNLAVLRERVPDESVDLVYLDPPFNSKKSYNAFLRTPDGKIPTESRLAFRDFWVWDHRSERVYEDLVDGSGRLGSTIKALRQILGPTDLLAYLVMMAPRLAELRRVLKPTGSIYLHCDQTASHYLKVLMDSVFGAENFLNNVVWLYGLGGSSKRYWPRKHDDLLWYSKKAGAQHFEATKVPAKSQRMKGQLKKQPDYWDIPSLNNQAKERLGFPTQKPLALLDNIIRSSSPDEGVVLDPFCGCGTTVVAAEQLGRTWVGIDLSYLAVDIIQKRLESQFGHDINRAYTLFGRPESMEEARELFEQQHLGFEQWAVTLVAGEPRRHAEEPFAGMIRFPMPVGQEDGLAGVQVPSASDNGNLVRDMDEALHTSGAAAGVILPLERDINLERAIADLGTWTWPVNGREYPRIQSVSVADLLGGIRPNLPPPLQPYVAA